MRLAFILGEIGSGLRRNLSMVVSVILVTFVSLSFVGAAGMLQMQINQMKGYWYDKVQVAIFLCSEGSTAAGCASGPVTAEQQTSLNALLEAGMFTPFGVATIGRLTRIGWATMASRIASSLAAGLVRPSSAAGVPRSRIRSRMGTPARAARSRRVSFVQPAFTYSTTVGSWPAARIMAKVLRDVPQAGLW